MLVGLLLLLLVDRVITSTLIQRLSSTVGVQGSRRNDLDIVVRVVRQFSTRATTEEGLKVNTQKAHGNNLQDRDEQEINHC